MSQFLNKAVRQMERLDQRVILLVCLLLVLLLGCLDYLTGFEFHFPHLLPAACFGACLVCGAQRRAGGVAAEYAAVWFASNKLAGQSYTSLLVEYWNTLVRLGFFVIVSSLLSFLKQWIDRERQLSRTDFMTGIINLRAFYEVAALELQRSARYRHPLSVAYMDVDNFKQVNDERGHNVGDALLKEVAQALRGCLRQTDIVARMGGDEFIVLLPEADEASAKAAITKALKSLHQAMEQGGWAVTFSVGVATFYETPTDVNEMIREVDELMYSVKTAGKNSVRFMRSG